MESTVAAPVSPQAPNITSPKAQSPKKHYIRTFSNSSLNTQPPRQQQGNRRNHHQNRNYHQNYRNHHHQNRSVENDQNPNNGGGKAEGARHVNNNQAANGWWRRTHEQVIEENKKKVIITGYPTYTNIQEIVKLLSQFGEVKVDRCNKIVTVLVYKTEQEAQKAVLASDQIVVYGKFIKINKFTCEKHVDDMSRSAKRTKSTVQDDIILPQEIDLSGDFYQQLDNIQAAIRLTAEEIEVISALYRDVEKVLQPLYPGCRAIPFGSITTGLGIKTSDADCFVEMPARFLTAGHDVRFVQATRRVLAARPQTFAEVVAIPGANTPIVKFRHMPTGTRCDLNCKTPLGALNSRLIGALLAHDARLPPLALLLKYWARVHRLSGTGRLTNYALVLLLVFYLQVRKVLPPIEQLQSQRTYRAVDHWDAGFAGDAIPPPVDDTPLPHLLGGFFQFYTEFDFDSLVVCPYLGVSVTKASFEENGAPPGLERYAANVARRLAGPLRHASPLCVQDPIEQSHNVATGVSANLATELKDHLKHAAGKYTASLPTCRSFLPSLLLTAPPRRPKHNNIVRIRLAPRICRAIQSEGDWRILLRDLIIDTVFHEMLALPLRMVPAVKGDQTTKAAEGNAELDSDDDDEETISVPKTKSKSETEISLPKTAVADELTTESTDPEAPLTTELETKVSSVTEKTSKKETKKASETEKVTEKEANNTTSNLEDSSERKAIADSDKVPVKYNDKQSTVETSTEKTTNTTKDAKSGPNSKGKKPSPEVDSDKKWHEVYTCVAERVTWERRRLCSPYRGEPEELLSREKTAAERLLTNGPELVEPLRLVVELSLSEDPRAVVVTARPLAGDLVSFRTLAAFLQSSLHYWLVILLRPYMPPPAPPTNN